jgi:hypothetical protein
MVPETLPPYRHITSTAISTADASSILATYLQNSTSHPHLHPNALITPSGVIFSANGGGMGGVTMHNLRRVAAGLRREYLEPEATPEPEEQAQDSTLTPGTKGKKRKEETRGANEDWQNMSEYEQEEQGVEVGEVGKRDNFVQSGADVPVVEATGGAEEEEDAVTGTKRKGEDSKEARKRAKKERNEKFKREKEKNKKRQEE